jgi:hypothetical protein
MVYGEKPSFEDVIQNFKSISNRCIPQNINMTEAIKRREAWLINKANKEALLKAQDSAENATLQLS